MKSLSLVLLPDTLAVCRLDPNAPIPPWANSNHFYSLTRTRDELSIVCAQNNVPDGIQCEKDFRALRIQGTLDFGSIGIIAALTKILADARISVFVISTFDTDYLLLRNENLERAVSVLTPAGHFVREGEK